MNNDKKIVIVRENGLVKLAQIDLYNEGGLSSFGTRVFAESEKTTDEALLNWAKLATSPDEANEVEIVSLETFKNDEVYPLLVKSIEEATEITDNIEDNPATTVNEAEN